MFRTNRPFFIALVCSWVALFLAAIVYSHEYPALTWVMSAAFPAFLLEVTFYLATMFESTRQAFARIASKRTQVALIWISVLLPYTVFGLAAGTFTRNAFYLLVILTAVFSFWYAVLPKRLAYDIGFLVIAAAPILLRVFPRIYLSPDQHVRVDILGHLMWIRAGVLGLLVLRGWDAGAFRLWPEKAEWRSGIGWFGVFVAPIIGVGLLLHDVRFDPLTGPWWKILGVAVGTFFGILWVVALGEELFFRGVIERALLNTWMPPALAIVLSTLIFGTAHLWFHAFPNWQRACTAGALGIACGIAYWRNGSVRAPMVTHALVVTTWRVFFK